MKVVALAGGVGGAKLVDGLSQVVPPEDLTIIVNTGDDFTHLGLKICPDVDTVCYTLAGIANPATGWGRVDETWNVLESMEKLGGPVWFQLGDRDLGTHLERTRLLKEGYTLSQVTRRFCRSWGIRPALFPMSDDPIATIVYTNEGELPFQEYFVRRRCRPKVKGFCFQGIDRAQPAPGVKNAIENAGLVVICPSNPWVSIDPILAVSGLKAMLAASPGNRSSVLAVSPIVGGQAIKGPAAKMYSELGIQPSALAVARHYGSRESGGLLAGFVLDEIDQRQEKEIQALGLKTLVTNTIMQTRADRRRLAEEIFAFGGDLE